MMKIQKRGIDDGVVNPTDQVRMAKHLLEASFMGNSTFFLVIQLILIFFLLFWFCLNLVELLNKLLFFFFGFVDDSDSNMLDLNLLDTGLWSWI